jgi:hypothetical protein
VVVVHPPLVEFLTQARADELHRNGLFADDPDGLATAWARLQQRWAATVDRARRLRGPLLDERVDGEWSFVETLRHLVFVTDAWVGDVVEEGIDPYHPWGMPPDFLADAAAALGLDLRARPSLDDVLVVRAGRAQQAGRVMAGLTPDELRRTCARRDGRYTVVGAVQTVLFEEWAHHEYATRDLAVLERAG